MIEIYQNIASVYYTIVGVYIILGVIGYILYRPVFSIIELLSVHYPYNKNNFEVIDKSIN